MSTPPLPPEFVAAIRASPADDVVRLVAADWFEEHGDPARAEFVRVQCAITAAIGSPADEEAAFEAHMVWRTVYTEEPPYPHDANVAAMLRRERELLAAHAGEWFTVPVRTDADRWVRASHRVRRGFVDYAAVRASEFVSRSADILAPCPELSELVIFGPRGQGAAIAESPAVTGVTRIELAGWLDTHDADALARSPYLSECRSLRVWVGNREQAAVVSAIAHGSAFAGLQELVLFQLYGGLAAGDSAADLDRQADELAAAANAVCGRPFARVERPHARRLPLKGDVGYGLYAGHSADRRPVVIAGDEGSSIDVVRFSADGNLLGCERINLPDSPAEYAGQPGDDGFDVALRAAIGFEPGVVFVHEFSAPAADLSVYRWGIYEHIISDPDRPRRMADETEEQICASLHDWHERGDFEILSGNDFWAGPDGEIHTS